MVDWKIGGSFRFRGNIAGCNFCTEIIEPYIVMWTGEWVNAIPKTFGSFPQCRDR